MTTWDPDILARIDGAAELTIAPTRRTGAGYRTPVPIWHVVVDGELYVRAYMGEESRWFRAARDRGTGRVSADGVTIEVTFDPVVDRGLDAAVDAAYRRKYDPSPYVAPMLTPIAHAHVLRVVPRGTPTAAGVGPAALPVRGRAHHDLGCTRQAG